MAWMQRKRGLIKRGEKHRCFSRQATLIQEEECFVEVNIDNQSESLLDTCFNIYGSGGTWTNLS